jgi:hypothetical protein
MITNIAYAQKNNYTEILAFLESIKEHPF